MNLTHDQFREILRKPAISKANPLLAGVVPTERKPNPRPALEQNPPRQPAVCGGVAIVVTLIAVRKRALDGDNLVAGFKHLRDEIARTLGVDDADARVRWEYGQVEGTRRGTIVKIEVV